MLLNADEIRYEGSSGPLDQRLISRDIVGQGCNLSGSSVARYIKINTLSDELKKFVD